MFEIYFSDKDIKRNVAEPILTTEKDQLPKKTGQRTLVFMDGSLALGDALKVLYFQ